MTSNQSEWLTALPDAAVLLHIDLDFFNNRFNGDSDWRTHLKRHDPCLADILATIDSIFASLAAGRVLEKVVDITVAISPGFFPAELWEPTVNAVRAHTETLSRTAGIILMTLIYNMMFVFGVI